MLCKIKVNRLYLKAILPNITLRLSKRTNAVKPERIKETMLKMLATKPRLQHKTFYELPKRPQESSTSTSFSKIRPKPNANKVIIKREKVLAAMLLKEIQDTIDSGQVGEELQNLNVKFNSAVYNGKHSCLISWESQGYELDIIVQNKLQSHAGPLSHIIMHNHVMGIVPKLTFCIDSSVEEEKQLSLSLNVIGNDLEQLERETNLQSEDISSVQNSSVVQSKSASINPAVDMFGVDIQHLREKILNKKSISDTDSSNEHSEGNDVAPDDHTDADEIKKRVLNIFNK